MSSIKLLSCPFCGMEPPDDLIDTLYPSGTFWRDNLRPNGKTIRSYHGRDAIKEGDGKCWTMHCTENMGGCGAEISGDSKQEAVNRWNRRVISENTNTVTLTKYVMVYRMYDNRVFCFSAINPTFRAKINADYIFAPGEYPVPMKDRHSIFSDSHPKIPCDAELMNLMGR